MKQLFSLFAIALTVCHFSCQNKKAELVDLDKRYRDSSQKYFDLAKICLDDDFKSHPHKTELERLRTHDTSDVISKKAMDRYKDLVRKGSECIDCQRMGASFFLAQGERILTSL